MDSGYEVSNKIKNKVLAYANDVYITSRDPESCRYDSSTNHWLTSRKLKL